MDIGFPRSTAQLEYFEIAVAPIQLVIVLQCSDEVLVQRLLHRGRSDDIPGTIYKRIDLFHETTAAVLKEFDERKRLKWVNGAASVEDIQSQLRGIFEVEGSRRRR